MGDNPNQKFIGKSVMIIGAHWQKGVTGTVKDVTLDNQAFISLNIFNSVTLEKIPFSSLRLA